MTRFTKNNNGDYVVSGKKYDSLIGTRAQVWHETAYKTTGGLTKSSLFKNKSGRIVSKAKHNSAKKEMRLLKAGYGTRKGKFGFVKVKKSRKSRSKKMRGGGLSQLNPSKFDGKNVGTSGVGLQILATTK